MAINAACNTPALNLSLVVSALLERIRAAI
jgi:hypothetical protein